MSKRDAKDISTIGPTAQEKTSWTPGSKNSPRQLPYEFPHETMETPSQSIISNATKGTKLPRNSQETPQNYLMCSIHLHISPQLKQKMFETTN